MSDLGHKNVWKRAWPIMLANSAVPLLGLADTAVVGNLGNLSQLGAIALGALIFSFIYWSFGFLRMGTTGFTAQAVGSGDEAEVRATLSRALLIAVTLGLALIALQWPIQRAAFGLLGGSEAVEAQAVVYFGIRIWSAPAVLSLYALMGTLIGLGRSRELLRTQLVLNGTNIVFDVLFAGYFGWGARGIAVGTLLAEWLALVYASLLVFAILRQRQSGSGAFWDWHLIKDRAKLLRTLGANSDILIRTLCLLFSFAWFTNQSARFGDAVLGANHVLLQLITFSAFFLDGYAFVAEALVGEALGAKQQQRLLNAVRRTTELAAITAVALALGILLFGNVAINMLTDIVAVRAAATQALPWSALYVLLSFPAFQLDGIFIGATRTHQMRNASLLSSAVFLLAWWFLAAPFGNAGLWWAFIIYVVIRAFTLLLYYPGVVREARSH